MTSEIGQSECFVYITLPGQTEPVTAGRFVLTKDRHGVSVGRFIYGRSYRDRPDAVELDPAELKLAPRTYETTAMGGVFGALRDAGPDYWGRRVIERHAGRAQLGELDYLLHSHILDDLDEAARPGPACWQAQRGLECVGEYRPCQK